MEIVSRKDARAFGLTRYFTGAPCKRGHVAERFVSAGSCLACKAVTSASYRARHSVRVTAARLARYAADPAKYVEAARRWEANHPEQWRAIANAVAARRRADKRNATLPWLSTEHRAQILNAYDEAVLTTKRTGIRHEVDHIVPLRGKTVSGLHVPWNLRVIPMRENRSKGNKIAA